MELRYLSLERAAGIIVRRAERAEYVRLAWQGESFQRVQRRAAQAEPLAKLCCSSLRACG